MTQSTPNASIKRLNKDSECFDKSQHERKHQFLKSSPFALSSVEGLLSFRFPGGEF